LVTEALAESINIDFGDGFASTLGDSFGAAADQLGRWNTIDSIGTTSPLLGLDGSATDVSLDLVGPADVGETSAWLTGDLALLMSDSFLTDLNLPAPTPWTVTLTGIDDGVYDIYVYAPSSSLIRTGPYTINGFALSDVNGSPIASFVEGTNYGLLSGLSVTGGSIILESTATSGSVGLAGIQLVQVPEPATTLLLVMGLALLAARRLG